MSDELQPLGKKPYKRMFHLRWRQPSAQRLRKPWKPLIKENLLERNTSGCASCCSGNLRKTVVLEANAYADKGHTARRENIENTDVFCAVTQ